MNPRFIYNNGKSVTEPNGLTGRYVDVIWRDGSEAALTDTAEKYSWAHHGGFSDIIAYRIINQDKL